MPNLYGPWRRKTTGQYSPKALSVRLADASGQPLPGVLLTFEVRTGEATFDRTGTKTLELITTGDDGVAKTSENADHYQILRAGLSNESLAVGPELEAQAPEQDSVLFSIPLSPIDTVQILAGDNQDVSDEDFFQQLQLRATDAAGDRLSHRQMKFAMTGEAEFHFDGQIAIIYTASTQWDGYASIPSYVLRAKPGRAASGTPVVVTAAVGDKTAEFNLRIRQQPRAWNLTACYGGSQTVAFGTAIPNSLSVQARDEQGTYSGYTPVKFETFNGRGACFLASDDTKPSTLTVETDRWGNSATPQLWTVTGIGGFTVKATTPEFAGEINFDLDVVGQPANSRFSVTVDIK